MNAPKFVLLTILDGWGIAPESAGNAITRANTPNMNKFWAGYPHTQLEASGQAVGLPQGEDGNTETGHLNLGAGRIVYQDVQRINVAIENGSFYKNDVLLQAIEHARKNNAKLHLMGLLGSGGVHSKVEHIYALLHLCKLQNFTNVYVHIFTDGRDSPPTAAKIYIKELEGYMEKEGVGKIASVMGRYWAMDRDDRWDRIEKAYNALTRGIGNPVRTPYEAIDNSYSLGETDEFVAPALVVDDNKNPIALIKDNDAVVFFNFRIDRPRQLTRAFISKEIKGNTVALQNPTNANVFQRGAPLSNLYFVTMTDYGKVLKSEGALPAFPPEVVQLPLSGVLAQESRPQLKITESEKERFVTFYFNGLREAPYELEEKIIIPSPKIPTYDQQPFMSADELTNTILASLPQNNYSLIVINFPNADMVGHTGNIGATVAAIEKIDMCIGKLATYVLAYDGAMVITADHGNAEEMINEKTGEIDTEHSINPVPFIAVSSELAGKRSILSSGSLPDVAPTILYMLGIPKPATMTGKNLLEGL